MNPLNPKIIAGLALVLPALQGCKTPAPINPLAIVRENAAIDQWIDPRARVEPVAKGFRDINAIAWSPNSHYMIISDGASDVLWKYVEGAGASIYFKPAGKPLGVEYDSYDRLVVYRESGAVRLDKSGQIRPIESVAPRRPYLLDAHGFQWTLVDGVATLLDENASPMGHIQIPDPAISFCWGDDNSTVYISTRNSVYRVKTSLFRAIHE